MNVTLDFAVTSVIVFQIQIDTAKKSSKILYEGNEAIVRTVIEKPNRNYIGVEKELQWMMNSKKEMPELIHELETTGFRFDGQTHLDVIVHHNWHRYCINNINPYTSKYTERMLKWNIHFWTLHMGI